MLQKTFFPLVQPIRLDIFWTDKIFLVSHKQTFNLNQLDLLNYKKKDMFKMFFTSYNLIWSTIFYGGNTMLLTSILMNIGGCSFNQSDITDRTLKRGNELKCL